MSRTTYAGLLFDESDFLSGFGSALDLGGSMLRYSGSDTPQEADLAALRSDLMAIGDDMREAMEERIAELRAK